MATYNAAQVPDLSVFPRTTYGFKIVSVDHSRDGEALKVVLKLAVTAPDSRKGQRYTERFMLGTDEDMNAEQPKTKREGMTGFNWARWLNFTKVTGVFAGDTEEEVAALNSTLPEFIADMQVREGKDKETGLPSGRKFNSLTRYYEVGKKEAREPSEDDQPVVAMKAAAKSGNAAVSPTDSGSTLCTDCQPPVKVNNRVLAQHKARHTEEQ